MSEAKKPVFINAQSHEVHVTGPQSELLRVEPWLSPKDTKRRGDRTYELEGEFFKRFAGVGGALKPFPYDHVDGPGGGKQVDGKGPKTVPGNPQSSAPTGAHAKKDTDEIIETEDESGTEGGDGTADANSQENGTDGASAPEPVIGYATKATADGKGSVFIANVTVGGALKRVLEAEGQGKLSKLVGDLQASPEWQTLKDAPTIAVEKPVRPAGRLQTAKR